MSDLKSDIEKYLHGTLTPAEMHLLEKRALNDPFLADALEGVTFISAEDFSSDVNYLHESLQKRTEKKIPLWLWYTRIAASLLFLLIAGYVVFNLVDKNIPKTELALNRTENPNAIQQPAIKEAPTIQQHSITPENDFTITPKEGAKNQPTPNTLKTEPNDIQKNRVLSFSINSEKSNLDETEKANLVSTWADDAKKMTEGEEVKSLDKLVDAPSTSSDYQASDQSNLAGFSEPKENESFKTEIEDSKKKTNRAAPSLSVTSTKFKEGKKELKVLQGKVIDDDGSPMPGVSVTLKDSSLGTVTDSEGNYKLTLDNDLRGELVFSFIGMQKAEIPIANNDSINAKLAPDFAELSEVVVVGYGSAEDDLTKEENINIYQPAAPDGGRKAYKNYLVENLKYPQQAIDDKVQGKVTVQFVIETDGKLNDFRVLKGIGYGCDEEVIRLIKKGPKWNPTKRNEVPTKGKVKVKVKFSLPE